MRAIRNDAAQMLRKMYASYKHIAIECGAEYTDIEAYFISEAKVCDPDFYRWLFNDESITDFGLNLTDNEKTIAKNFFKTL